MIVARIKAGTLAPIGENEYDRLIMFSTDRGLAHSDCHTSLLRGQRAFRSVHQTDGAQKNSCQKALSSINSELLAPATDVTGAILLFRLEIRVFNLPSMTL